MQLATSSRIKKFLTSTSTPLKRNIGYDADDEDGEVSKKPHNTSITGGEVGRENIHAEDIDMEANTLTAPANWQKKYVIFL